MLAKIAGTTEKADPNEEAALTAAQLKRLQTEIAALGDDDASAYADVIYSQLGAIVEISFDFVRDMLHLESGFDVVPTWALDAAQEASQNVGSILVQRDKDALDALVTQAMIDGQSSKALAKAIVAAGITSDNKTMDASDWALMVARTELQRAAVDGQIALYEAAGIEKVRWQAAEPCDECADYDDQIFVLADMEDVPPLHPNCRCVLIPEDKDLGSHRGTDEERATARQGNQEEE